MMQVRKYVEIAQPDNFAPKLLYVTTGIHSNLIVFVTFQPMTESLLLLSRRCYYWVYHFTT